MQMDIVFQEAVSTKIKTPRYLIPGDFQISTLKHISDPYLD